MKTKSFAPMFAVVIGLLQSANGQTVLFSDNFNSYVDWDDIGVAADQGGTYAGTGYTTAISGSGPISHSSALDQPYGDNSLLVESPTAANPTTSFVSLNHNFATDANSADSPLTVSFYVQATGPDDRWVALTLGSTQDKFVTHSSNQFAALFRNLDNGTYQFNAGNLLSGQGTLSYSQSTGSIITLIFSDTAGTGSAFDGISGSKVAFYVDDTPFDNIDNSTLAQTFTLGQMTSADGYLTFHGYGTRGVFDNLVVKANAGVSDYDTWKSDNGVTGGVNDDDDNDGLSNFEEYAFGLLPNSGASSNPFVQPLDKNTGEFKYTRRNTTLFATGIAYSYEYSTTLEGAWDPLTLAGAPTSDDGNPNEVVTVTVDSSLLSNPKLFIRVKAE